MSNVQWCDTRHYLMPVRVVMFGPRFCRESSQRSGPYSIYFNVLLPDSFVGVSVSQGAYWGHPSGSMGERQGLEARYSATLVTTVPMCRDRHLRHGSPSPCRRFSAITTSNMTSLITYCWTLIGMHGVEFESRKFHSKFWSEVPRAQ